MSTPTTFDQLNDRWPDEPIRGRLVDQHRLPYTADVTRFGRHRWRADVHVGRPFDANTSIHRTSHNGFAAEREAVAVAHRWLLTNREARR